MISAKCLQAGFARRQASISSVTCYKDNKTTTTPSAPHSADGFFIGKKKICQKVLYIPFSGGLLPYILHQKHIAMNLLNIA
jgi:hypothetical protein